MSKELKAFYESKQVMLDLFVDIGDCKNNLDIIEIALKDHTKIKELFEKFDIEDVHNLEVRLMNYELITNKNKVLEIIKDKNVDLQLFREEFVEQNNEYNFYLENYDYYHYGNYKDALTEEEFDLLKEVLK